jgi:hypothetical protein
MLEAHNSAMASRVSTSRVASRGHAHMWWGVLIAFLGVAGIAAVVVLALLGLTTEALIVAIFTGAFFSRCLC